MTKPAILRRIQKDQQGLASFVIVGVLVILLTLISVGFAKIMSRSQNNALNNQLSASAKYAAESALNDVSAYVAANPTVSSNTCNPANAGLQAIYNKGNNLSSNSSKSAAYTCLLVNPNPTDLIFRQVPPDDSQVVSLDPSLPKNIDQIMISWQGSTSSNRAFPASSSSNLPDQKTWNSSGYTPILRVTLYPIQGTSLPAPTDDRTFFLYPYSGGSVLSVPTQMYKFTDGKLYGVPCNTNGTRNTGSFSGSADQDCNIVIDKITAGPPGNTADYFYARVTPLYGPADIQFKANYKSSVNPVNVSFQNGQSVVDVTAKDGTAVKRLQARLDIASSSASASSSVGGIIPGDNDISEYGLQSASAICKRLDISGGTFVLPPGGTSVACSAPITTNPPQVTLTSSPNAITVGNTSTLTWTVTGLATSCSYTSAPNNGAWNGNTQTTSGNQTLTFNSTGTFNFSIQCSNGAGAGNTATAAVNVSAPSSPPTCPPGYTGVPPNCTAPSGGGGGGGGGSPPKQTINVSISSATPTSGQWRATVNDNGDGAGLWYCVVSDSALGFIESPYFPNSPPIMDSGTINDNWQNKLPPYGSTITINCYSTDSNSPEGSASYTIAIPPVQVQSSIVGAFHFTGSLPGPPQTCHDGLHPYILCFSWNAWQDDQTWHPQDPLGSEGGVVPNCSISFSSSLQGSSGAGYSNNGITAGNPVNWNYWNVTLGWFSDPGSVSGTITCTSSTYGNSSSPNSFSIAAGSFCDTRFGGSPCGGGGGGGGGSGGGGGGGGGGSSLTRAATCYDDSGNFAHIGGCSKLERMLAFTTGVGCYDSSGNWVSMTGC